MNDTDPLLLQAAKAVSAKLPELESKRVMLQKELDELTTKISQYKNIVLAANVDFSAVPEADQQIKRLGRGNCMADIDSVLDGNPMTAREITEAIATVTGTIYPYSTMNLNLKKGQQTGRFKVEQGKWSKI